MLGASDITKFDFDQYKVAQEPESPVHLLVFIWQTFLYKATYEWGAIQVTVNQTEAFKNTCINTQFH